MKVAVVALLLGLAGLGLLETIGVTRFRNSISPASANRAAEPPKAQAAVLGPTTEQGNHETGTVPIAVTAPTELPHRRPEPAFLQGDWKRRDEVIEQRGLGRPETLLFGSPDLGDGDFTCEIRRRPSASAVSLVFRASNIDHYYYFEPGSFGNKFCDIFAHEPGTGWRRINRAGSPGVPSNEWVRLRVKLRGPSIEAFLNDKLILTGQDAVRLHGYIGLRTWDCPGEFRNPKFTDPSGKILWEGPPELPTDSP